MIKLEDRDIKKDSSSAYMFNLNIASGNKLNSGGYDLKHNPSCYGIAIKWLLHIRRMTYNDFGKRYNGTSGQNINYIINRMPKKRYFKEDIEKICSILDVSEEYFEALTKNILINMRRKKRKKIINE